MMLTPEISTPSFLPFSHGIRKISWEEPRDDHTALLWHNAEEGLGLMALIGSPDAYLLEPSV